MAISHEYQLIFIHVPKNAGTSIIESLGMEEHGHHQIEHYNQYKHYTSFAVVRNPWDRVVSNYEYAKMSESYWHSLQSEPHPDLKLLNNLNFKQTVDILYNTPNKLKHDGWKLQTLYTHYNDKPVIDKIFYYEEMEKLEKWLQQYLPSFRLKNINPSKKEFNNYRSYYDEETKKKVSEIYEKDIRLFNYKF